MKRFIRFFAWVLALLTLAGALGACSGVAEESGTPAESTEAPVPAPVLVSGGKVNYAIIRSSDAAADVTKAVTALNTFLRNASGLSTSLTEDFLSRDRTDNDDFEILVGNTNRPLSAERAAGLSARDWVIESVGNKILILGGSDEATVQAAERFTALLEEAFAGKQAGEEVSLEALTQAVRYTASYSARPISIGGTPIAEFTVTYSLLSGYKGEEAAENLVKYVAETCGVLLKTRKSSSSKELEHEIVVGNTGKGLSDELCRAAKGDIPYTFTFREGRLYLCGKDGWGVNAALTRLLACVAAGQDIPADLDESGEAAGTTVFPLTAGADLRIMTNNVWKCDSNQSAWAAKGENCSAGSRSPEFAKIYIAFRPDVICFQEMSTTMLSAVLTDMRAAGLNYKRLVASPDDTPIIYNADTLKMIDNGQHLFTYGNNGNSKGYHWALFERLSDGKQFIALSTHFWWKSEADEPGSDESRRKQAAEIVRLAEKLLAQYNVPMFIQGDLNTRISTSAYAELKNGSFEDCHDIAAAADNTHGHHQCGNDGYSTELYSGDYSTAIDHMLVKNRGDWKILAFRQPTTDFFWRLTDHVPVYIDIQIP